LQILVNDREITPNGGCMPDMVIRQLGEVTLSQRITLWISLLCLGSLCFPMPTHAQNDGSSVKIGVLTDMSGPFSEMVGPSSLEAAKMAAEDFGLIDGRKVEVISGDHQNKPDIGAGIVRRWFDLEGVDAVADVPVSSVALAVQFLARDKKKVVLFSAAISDRLNNEDCAPYSVQWMLDVNVLARSTVKSIVAEGGTSWYFVVADYAFGHSMEKASQDMIEKNGGKFLGSVRHPSNASDMASFMLKAQESKAKIIGLANVGPDLRNSVASAVQFGLTGGGQKLASLILYDNDVISMGLPTAAGLLMTTAYYWDLDDQTRAFGKRFFERRGVMPNMIHASIYSSITHYLKAIKATGSKDPEKVMTWMKSNAVNDFFARNATLRPDGLLQHDIYLMQVKKPEESTGKFDVLKVVRKLPGNEAYAPLSDSKCPLVPKGN